MKKYSKGIYVISLIYGLFILPFEIMMIFQEVITGAGHSSAIDWWAVGKLINFHELKFFFKIYTIYLNYLLLPISIL